MLGTTTDFFGATTTLVQTFYHIPIAWFVLFIVFVLCAFDSYRGGGARVSAAAVALSIAIFLAGMASNSFGMGEIIKAFHIDAYPAIIIGILFVAVFFIIARMVEPTIGGGGLFSGLIGGVGGSILFIALWVGTPALAALLSFNPLITTIFGEAFRLYWILGGYAALAFARG